jgi:hypothetical protein
LNAVYLRHFIPLLFVVVALTAIFPQSTATVHSQIPQPPEYDPDFLFNVFSEDCTASCWHDMRMGETPILTFIRFLGGLNFRRGISLIESIVFCYSTSKTDWFVSHNFPIENVQSGNTRDTFEISLWGCEYEEKLQNLVIGLVAHSVLDYAPARIIETFGTPDDIYLAYVPPSLFGTLWMAYNDLKLYFRYDIQPLNEAGDFCLYPEFWMQGLPYLFVHIIGTEDELGIDDPRSLVSDNRFRLDEISDYDVDSFVELVTTEAEPCMPVSSELYGGTIPSAP